LVSKDFNSGKDEEVEIDLKCDLFDERRGELLWRRFDPNN